MSTTLKDIAAAAGVSIGTVERALKNHGRINPEVAERIRALAAELDYHPNTVAKGLVNRSRKYRIGVVLHIRGNDFFDTVLAGVRSAAAEIADYGITTEIYPCEDFSVSDQLRQIDRALADGASALILVPIDSPVIREKLRELHQQGIPVVFLNEYLDAPFCLTSIHCDYYRSGRIGASLLQRLAGPGSHALVCMPSHLMRGNDLRKNGIVDFLHSSSQVEMTELLELTNQTATDAELISASFQAHPEIDALIFCGNARSVQIAMQRHPRALHAVFYDLSPEIREMLLNGQIDATVTQYSEEQGRRAVQVLFQYFTAHAVPPSCILIDSHIDLKESIEEIPGDVITAARNLS